jgi:hypothetical protein
MRKLQRAGTSAFTGSLVSARDLFGSLLDLLSAHCSLHVSRPNQVRSCRAIRLQIANAAKPRSLMVEWLKLDKEMATATDESVLKLLTRMEAYPKMDSVS